MSAQKKRPAPAPARKRTANRWVFPAVVGAIFVVGVIAVIVVASGGDSDSSGGGGGGGGANAVEVSAEVSVDGTALPDFTGERTDPAVGRAAPTLGSVDFQGDDVTVGGATGSPYALVFLAHWCPHCQVEVPRLVNLAEDGQIEGVDVIGVATGTSTSNPNYPPSEWLAGEGWPFPVLVDDARFSAANAYGLTSYPYLVFVGADGKVVGRTSGEVSEADLTEIFTALARGERLPLPGAGASSSS